MIGACTRGSRPSGAFVRTGRRALLLAMFGCTSMMAGAANAPAPVEEMVVTGSYIRSGTPQDEALPVSVFTAEDLEEQGSPNIVELVQRIPAVNGGNIGESNRFLGGAPQGTASVNLRGLGLTRTLVLMNGQRLAPVNGAGADYVDINQIPMAALARVEVLRDGAAAVYGSDAVAGVVNFITRRDLDGLDVNVSYKGIENSDGEYDASFAYGWTGERGNVIMAAGYRRRYEVRLFDFDFMSNTRGGDGVSGASNPGRYFTLGSAVDADGDGGFETATQGTQLTDQGCIELGSTFFDPATRTACKFPYSHLEAPINDEKHWNFFVEANFDLADDLRFHAEAHWARNIVPNIRESPSLSTILFPTPIEASGASAGGGTSPFPARGGDISSRYYIPPANPGLTSLMTGGGCPYGGTICADALARGLLTHQTGWRLFALGGNPLFDGDTSSDKNQSTSFRISAGLDGDFANDWGWTTRVTYARGERYLKWHDMAVSSVQLALRGLGGPGCDPRTGTPGVGNCEWLNPFANSIEQSFLNGLSYSQATGRPQGPVNSKRLVGWLRSPLEEEVQSQLLTFEGVVNGDIGFFKLPGGEITWALGTQWRYTDRDVAVNDIYDVNATPCVDSPPFGDGVPSCPTPGVGAFMFRNPVQESYLDRDVLAFFGELKLPVLDSLEFSIAVRREDYGGEIGSTTNPRVSARWQPLEWLVLRGSAGSTFRAPPESITAPGRSRFQAQFTNPVDGSQLYRAVDIANDPTLEPEEADTYNVGFVISTDELELFGMNVGAYNLTVDYFIVNFEKELSAEGQAPLYRTMFPNATAANWQCGNDAIRSRFTFVSGLGTNNTDYNGAAPGGVFENCHPNNFNAVEIKRLNGASTDIKGVDVAAFWDYADIFGSGGDLQLGVESSYLLSYERSAVSLVGTSIIVEPETDRAGTAELLGSFFSYPEWRTFAFARYKNGGHNVRWTSRYYSSVQDRNAGFKHRRAHTVHDLTYMYTLEEYNLTVTGTVANLLDVDPPFIRSQNNYDYANLSALGRTFEVGVKWHME